MFSSSRRERGYTLSELMTVTVILGLVLTFVAAFVGPLLRAHYQSQAKTDTIQVAASALYELERDLRNTTYSEVYACTTGATPSCVQAPATFNSTYTAIVFPTAYQSGRGQFQVVGSGGNQGKPKWLGAIVYWIDSSGQLRWGFDPPAGFVPGPPAALTAALAAAAVTDVQSGTHTTIANNVQQLMVSAPGTANVISVQMQAQSTLNGITNKTTLTTTVLTRNKLS